MIGLPMVGPRLRWCPALWLPYRALRVAPDGNAAMALEDLLRDWGTQWQMF